MDMVGATRITECKNPNNLPTGGLQFYIAQKESEYQNLNIFLADLSTGERIKHFRLYLNWTQRQLADKVGISIPTLGHYENGGTQDLKGSTLKKFADVFSIPAVYLLDETWW